MREGKRMGWSSEFVMSERGSHAAGRLSLPVRKLTDRELVCRRIVRSALERGASNRSRCTQMGRFDVWHNGCRAVRDAVSVYSAVSVMHYRRECTSDSLHFRWNFSRACPPSLMHGD